MIADRPELSHIDLRDLLEDRVTAIRIPGYYPAGASAAVAAKLIGSCLHGQYENAKEIGRVGQAFFESNASPEAGER